MRKPIDKIPAIPENLTCAEFQGPTQSVAKWLLGKALVRKQGRSVMGGIIVETEAYLKSGDPACHSFRGQTPRNSAMFSNAGALYVYSIHAKYCLNVVTENEGEGCAVLIRALEPVWGHQKLAANRGRVIEKESTTDWRQIVQLTNGPAKICQALDVDLTHNKANLVDDPRIWIGQVQDVSVGRNQIVASPRIGISTAVDRKLRFFVDRNQFVSGRKSTHSGKADQSLFRIKAIGK